MKIGIYTPGLQPAVRKRVEGADWQRSDRAAHARDAEITTPELVDIATAADRLGYEFLSCSQHIALNEDVAQGVGGSWWDPLSTFGFLAAHTTRVRFATLVIVLGYQHPLQIVKEYSTLDRVSNGRVILGVGVGELRPEFELLGVEFEGRGPRADDALRVLRAAFANPMPQYSGEFFRVSGVVVEPTAVQASVPIWVGGRTRRSLERALALGDGWAPFGRATADLQRMMSDPQVRQALDDRGGPFDFVLTPRILDPLGDPGAATALLERYEAIGATQLAVLFDHTSTSHYLEQMAALAALAGLR
jgi:probable F420-dependent oxidoreductase